MMRVHQTLPWSFAGSRHRAAALCACIISMSTPSFARAQESNDEPPLPPPPVEWKSFRLTLDGYLRVRAAERPIGQHVAIDLFFRTLADVHRSRSFGIILSGTGADGAVGLARLKEQGGVTIAQDPDDAEYDGMPLAAVHSGMVDFVLPVALMPQKLIDLWRNARSIILPPLEPSAVPAATVKTTTASALPASPHRSTGRSHAL